MSAGEQSRVRNSTRIKQEVQAVAIEKAGRFAGLEGLTTHQRRSADVKS